MGHRFQPTGDGVIYDKALRGGVGEAAELVVIRMLTEQEKSADRASGDKAIAADVAGASEGPVTKLKIAVDRAVHGSGAGGRNTADN